MVSYNYDHNEEDKTKKPVIVWESTITKDSSLGYRLVVVYNILGTKPQVILEKSSSFDTLGIRIWAVVPIDIIPYELWKDLIESYTDEFIMTNKKKDN